MLLSRFWYAAMGLALTACVAVLFIAQSFYNRSAERAMGESLSADATAVDWFLKDDARNRATALIPVALDPELRELLAKVSDTDEIANDARNKAKARLTKLANEVPEDTRFTAVWAVDAGGRVIADVGWDHRPDWNLGGYSVVADALAGWTRDDAWVLREKLYRVVARPVENEVNGAPVGAIVALSAFDDRFADAVSRRTGTAVAFYALGTRIATGAPVEFRKADLDVIQSDLKELADNKDYLEKGRSAVRRVGQGDLGIVYARIRGEAWDLQSGYAVGRTIIPIGSPLDFLTKAEKTDTDKAPKVLLILIALGLVAAGMAFSVLEHTIPLRTFAREALQLAEGKTDHLAPSRFRGLYKKIASDINDGIDKIAAKGGVPRKAADLESVLGPMPAQPVMSAFAVPEAPSAPTSSPSIPGSGKTTGDGAKKRPPPPPGGGREAAVPASDPGAISGITALEDLEAESVAAPPAPPKRGPAAPPPRPSGAHAAVTGDGGELDEWRHVFDEYKKVREQCGEATSGLTFEKFQGTLQKNKAAILAKHPADRVRFTVYVKDGKAALKASPVKAT
jgi:hypothetical protein